MVAVGSHTEGTQETPSPLTEVNCKLSVPERKAGTVFTCLSFVLGEHKTNMFSSR